jgi:hypothetical protein
MRVKLLACIVVICACATCVTGTWQSPDILIYEGVVYQLDTPLPNGELPLDALKGMPPLSPRPGVLVSTACWRGYVAIWEVHEGVLYLKGLNAWVGDTKANLRTLFPDRYKEGKVKADWFTGGLVLTTTDGRTRKEIKVNTKITLRFQNGALLPDKAIDRDR